MNVARRKEIAQVRARIGTLRGDADGIEQEGSEILSDEQSYRDAIP